MSDLSLRPCFPAVLPRSVDPLWHRVDEARDENAELTRLEREQEIRKKSIAKSYSDVPPIGKTSQEPLDDDDDDEDDDNDDQDDDNDSDSHEEEEEDVDMDMNNQEDIEGTLNTLAAGMTPPDPTEHPNLWAQQAADAAAAAAAIAEEEAAGGGGGDTTANEDNNDSSANNPPETQNSEENE